MKSTPDKMLGEWFWTDRWMGSSAFLLPMEPRGLYREMLTQAWRRGARLPNDHETIQRAVGCTSAEWKRCWLKIERYWRVDGEDLVNETQLEVYAKCQEEQQRKSSRGQKGGKASAQARAQARAQVATQAPTQAPTQVDTQAPLEDVLEHHPPDPDPEERSKDQERSTRGRARVFTGQRLKVSQAQHQVVLDELGPAAAGLDLSSLYAIWDADLVKSGEPFDVLAYIKRRTVEAIDAGRAASRPPSVDWFEECQRLHAGACEGDRMRHHLRKSMDDEKSRTPVVA